MDDFLHFLLAITAYIAVIFIFYVIVDDPAKANYLKDSYFPKSKNPKNK